MTQNSSFASSGATTAQLFGGGSRTDASKLTALNAPTPPKPSLPLPSRFKDPQLYKDAKDLIDEPLNKPSHPLYKTSNSEYGGRPPEAQELPQKYYGNAHSFSKTFAGGMTRNCSLTTSKSDK